MTMKKKILTTLSVVLILGLAALGILAYLSDTDNDVNVMTLGNVQIDQIEQEWDANGTALQDFTQAKPLYPYVGKLGWENEEANDGAYRTFTMNNVVDKYVSVKNTGKSDAYVRTVFAFEMGEYDEINEFYYNVIGTSTNAVVGAEFKFPGTWVWGDKYVGQIDGKNYMIWEAVYEGILKPGKTTIPSLLQVYMNPACGNEEVKKVDGNNNGTYDILVLSQAVQVEGFADAKTALKAGFGEANEANVKAWFGGVNVPVIVSSADELEEAIQNGEKDILVEAGTYTFPASSIQAGTTLHCDEGTVFEGTSALDINGATVIGATFSNATGNVAASSIEGNFKNCTFTGYNVLSNGTTAGDVTFEGCTIDGDNYGIHFDSGTGENNIVFKNCKITGYTTFAASIESVVFEGCEFINEATDPSGATQVNIWGGEATFKDCHFDEFFWMIFVPGDATINIDNVTYDGNLNDFFYQKSTANVTWNFEGTVYTVTKY